jgi:hypothetical protein
MSIEKVKNKKVKNPQEYGDPQPNDTWIVTFQ